VHLDHLVLFTTINYYDFPGLDISNASLLGQGSTTHTPQKMDPSCQVHGVAEFMHSGTPQKMDPSCQVQGVAELMHSGTPQKMDPSYQVQGMFGLMHSVMARQQHQAELQALKSDQDRLKSDQDTLKTDQQIFRNRLEGELKLLQCSQRNVEGTIQGFQYKLQGVEMHVAGMMW